jgi:4-hydroxybenzoate polyprenyltransferase
MSGRPLAAGQISLLAAAAEAALLFVAAVAVAWTVNQIVLGIIVAYLLMQLVYTLWLKQKMLVDVICIAMGFVLRAAAGAVAIPVEVSPWLFVCTFTICLFMGFCKRCNELATLAVREEARQHRRTLGGYSPELLTHLITLSAGVAIVAFLLYASSNRTVNNLGTNYLIYTLPAVVYGISRFAMLSMKGVYSDPTALILRDRPFQYTMAIWFATVIAIIFWGHDVERWLRSLI